MSHSTTTLPASRCSRGDMEVLMTTNGAYNELQGTTNRRNQANKRQEWQRTETTNGRERKRRMAGNGNDEQQGTDVNQADERQVTSSSTPPSLQMRDGGAVLFFCCFSFSFFLFAK
jgi:hypothetical protein